jgi:hypothetical protein
MDWWIGVGPRYRFEIITKKLRKRPILELKRTFLESVKLERPIALGPI